MILFLSLAFLVKFSHLVIDSSVKIARITRLGELVIGFIFLSIATNVPEMGVAFSAITTGDIGITIGNILGSNVANIALVIGIISLLTTIKITKGVLKDIPTILFLSSVIPLSLISFLTPSRLIGLILVFTFVGFCYYSVKKKITPKKIIPKEHLTFFQQLMLPFRFYKTIGVICLGLLGVLISARFVVYSSSNIAKILGIVESVIGATIISIGTTLPELSIAISATKKGHVNLALGDVIGSCLTKITLVLGLVLIFSQFVVNISVFSTLVMFVLLSNILIWFFLERGILGRKEGILLLILYFVFLISVFGVQITLFELFGK